MTEQAANALENKFEGFKSCFGGEELKRATATLAGAIAGNALKSTLTTIQDVDDIDYHVRELAFAAKQYSDTAHDRPADYDTLYNHGLVLQELAGKMANGSREQVMFLRQACDKYKLSVEVRPTSSAALYNWGVALSDLARAVKEPDPSLSRSCLHSASQKYAASLRCSPNNPQALNNWGLVLQELCADAEQPAERDRLVQHAVGKFRQAIRSRPDFDRGCYNLGTVFYTHACALQTELAAQPKGSYADPTPGAVKVRQAKEFVMRRLFNIAAQYICLSYALQPHKEIYRKSLSVVKQMLPLPFLRAGYLTAVTASTHLTISETWRREWIVLDHLSLRSASNMESSLSTASAGVPSSSRVVQAASEDEPPLTVKLHDIVTVRRCSDPSLPEGDAFWIGLESIPQGVYVVADDAESADAWIDALVLAQHLVQTRGNDALAEALAPVARRAMRVSLT